MHVHFVLCSLQIAYLFQDNRCTILEILKVIVSLSNALFSPFAYENRAIYNFS